MKAVLDHTRDEANNITTFFFRPERPVRYTAGQYTELTLPHPHPDKRGIRRWFTLSSAPEGEFLTVTTKFAAERGSTFKHALRRLRPGTEVHLAEPMGDFVLPKLIQTPLVFVAGGIGLTPFHSIAEWLEATHETRPVTFLYGVRSEDEIIFEDTFRRVGIDPKIIVSDPSPAWGGERGRLNAELILALARPADNALLYISGPEPMVQALHKDLHHAGIRKEQLVSDEFPNYTDV